MNNFAEFHNYVLRFYGSGPDVVYPMGATLEQIREATQILLDRIKADPGEAPFDGDGDSFDRERVRDILIEKFGLVFPEAPLKVEAPAVDPPSGRWQWMSNHYGGMGWFSAEEKAKHEGTEEFTDGHWRSIPVSEAGWSDRDIGRLAYEQS